MPKNLAEWADEPTVLTVYYIGEETPAEESREGRYANDRHLNEVANTLGLTEFQGWYQLCRDASGGLVLITETEVG